MPCEEEGAVSSLPDCSCRRLPSVPGPSVCPCPDALGAHPPVAAEGQVHRQGEDILYKLLVDLEEVAEVLLRDAEAKQHPDGHAEGELLRLLVHVDGLGVAAPGTQRVLDHQLDLGQVALQGLMAEDLGKDLGGREACGSAQLRSLSQ